MGSSRPGWSFTSAALIALCIMARGLSAQPAAPQPPAPVAVPAPAPTPPLVVPPTIFDEDEEWVSIGPRGIPIANGDVISGQVNVIAVHPTDANTLYIGASEGGIWKTIDGGTSWRAVADFQLVRQLPSGIRRGTTLIGALAIDPSRPETVYAGTGNPHFATGFRGPALGVFRSTDAGLTWTPTGVNLTSATCQNAAMSQAVVNRILIRRGTPNTIFAATDMGLLAYRDDGSDCWRRITQGLPTSGNAVDLVTDTFSGVFYVAFRSNGVFQSQGANTNSWTQLTQGLPAPFSQGFGRIALAFAGREVDGQPPTHRLYAGIDLGGIYHLFHSADAGTTWVELPSPPSENQIDFNSAIAVGLFDGDEVYVGQVALRRARDGGRRGGVNNPNISPPVTGHSWDNLSCCLAKGNTGIAGLDLHADIHDIVFAPPGSYVPTSTEAQIVYIANDGGVVKGSIASSGFVHWKPLTRGLAIGQCGTMGLNPEDRDQAICGLWHNGNGLVDVATGTARPVGGGDGFNATFDATPIRTVVYENCNAGFDGDVCRDVRAGSGFSHLRIWDVPGAAKHWSDPYRPGHLFLLHNGLLFRTTAGDTATQAELLNGPKSWVLIEPPGKRGFTTTMAFRSWVLEEQPVYYLGTDSGQIFRGSPEAGWTKLCECGLKVNGLSSDLLRNERVYAVFNSQTSPGRIKLLSRFGTSPWSVQDIDATFTPALRVNSLTSVAAKPFIPFVPETTVYVGSEQGLYRGRFQQGVWSWTQALGMPNVLVTDLEVHQSARFFDLTRIIRASTYGRGMFELRRARGPVVLDQVRAVSVRALRIGGDGAPTELTVRVQANSARERGPRDTPFELAPSSDAKASLQAPPEITDGDTTLTFAGWLIDGKRSERQNPLTLTLDEVGSVIANYEATTYIASPKQAPGQLNVSVTATAQNACVAAFSHEISVTWEIGGAQPPVVTRFTVTYPDKSNESGELRGLSGSRTFPANFPEGGAVSVQLTVEDGSKAKAPAQASLKLPPCRQ